MVALIRDVVQAIFGLPDWLLEYSRRSLRIVLCLACLLAPAAVADGIAAAAQDRAMAIAAIYSEAISAWVDSAVDRVAHVPGSESRAP
jgi:hypothetical protein